MHVSKVTILRVGRASPSNTVRPGQLDRSKANPPMTNTFPNPSTPAPAPNREVYSCQEPGLGRRPAKQHDPGSDGENSLPFASPLSLSVLLTRRPRSECGSALPSWWNHGAKAFLLEPAWRPHHATRWAVKPSKQLLSGALLPRLPCLYFTGTVGTQRLQDER